MFRSVKGWAQILERAFFPCTRAVEQVIADHKKECEETVCLVRSIGRTTIRHVMTHGRD